VYSDFFKIPLPTLHFEKTEEIDKKQSNSTRKNITTETAIGTCIITTKMKTQPAQPADKKHRWKRERHANERHLKKQHAETMV
jgi:hypothetical protein